MGLRLGRKVTSSVRGYRVGPWVAWGSANLGGLKTEIAEGRNKSQSLPLGILHTFFPNGLLVSVGAEHILWLRSAPQRLSLSPCFPIPIIPSSSSKLTTWAASICPSLEGSSLKGRIWGGSPWRTPASPSMGQGAKEVKEKRRRKQQQLVYLASPGDRSRQPAGLGQTHSGPHAHRSSGCRWTAVHTDGLGWKSRMGQSLRESLFSPPSRVPTLVPPSQCLEERGEKGQKGKCRGGREN